MLYKGVLVIDTALPVASSYSVAKKGICVGFVFWLAGSVLGCGDTDRGSNGTDAAGGDAFPVADSDVFPVSRMRLRVEIPEHELSFLNQCLRAVEGLSLSGCMHCVHVYGADTQCCVRGCGDESIKVADVLLRPVDRRSSFDGLPIYAKTRFGWRFCPRDDDLLSNDYPNVEAHLGQGLSVIAGMGVAASRKVQSKSGESFAVQAIVDDMIANFSLESEEIYWVADALASYIPPKRTWVNKFGRAFSFDDVVQNLVNRDFSNSSCGGTHGLISLTRLLIADKKQSFLQDAVRESAHQHLRYCIGILRAGQLSHGGWGLDWHVDSQSRLARRVADDDLVLVTGHHLEWLLLYSMFEEIDREMIETAAHGLLRALQRQPDLASWCRDHYCPASHAIRSLNHLSEQVSPATRLDVVLNAGIE